MRLSLGPRSYDLTTRALVIGTVERAGSIAGARQEGADIVEVHHFEGPLTVDVPVCVAPPDERVLEAGLAAGASMARLGDWASTAGYVLCARAGAAVIVVAAAAPAAEAAGVSPDRIVVESGDARGRYPVMVDVTASPFPVVAAAAGVLRGARIVRAHDARGARRVCDVLAAIMEAP